ncbi:MAG: D-glycerate dehydrogenase [Cyclobacteriaceae bacterium]
MNDSKSRKVFASRAFPQVAIDLLEKAKLEVRVWQPDRPMTQDELIRESLKSDALICMLSDRIDKDFLNTCKHLDIISQFAVGYDNIDIAEATRLNIPIGNTPDAMTEATADIAFGLMIATSRKMFYLHKSIIDNQWDFFRPNANLGIELSGKILGIVGLGRIGIAMAKRCKGAYGMSVLYHNRKRNLKIEQELNAQFVDFDELLADSDVVSVHCPLNAETKEIFDKSAFKKMKPSSIFINTARGGIHNEKDLIQALNEKQIWGAGLDVTNPEPMLSDNPLLSMENVCVLPHVGSGTVEARDEMARLAAENIIQFYRTGKVPNQVLL